jgi:hypothetical protein
VRKVYQHSTKQPGEEANEHGSQQDIAPRVRHIFGKRCYGIETEIGEGRKRSRRRNIADPKRRRIEKRLHGK